MSCALPLVEWGGMFRGWPISESIMPACPFQNRSDVTSCNGVDSSLAGSLWREPATCRLQIRAHLATVTMYRGSNPVASSRAMCNGRVASSARGYWPRENRVGAPPRHARKRNTVVAAERKKCWRPRSAATQVHGTAALASQAVFTPRVDNSAGRKLLIASVAAWENYCLRLAHPRQ
jgi:hypothetical protein